VTSKVAIVFWILFSEPFFPQRRQDAEIFLIFPLRLSASAGGNCGNPEMICVDRILKCATFCGYKLSMSTLDIFSARDLRNRSGDLLRESEAGNLSIITKHGRPAALAVPFDEALLALGLPTHLAVRLFDQRLITLAQASKLAGKPIEDFIEILGASNVDVVDFAPEELGNDLDVLK
jgi:prevent-host-death family protein